MTVLKMACNANTDGIINGLVTLFAFTPATQDKLVMAVAPGHAHLLALKILCTVTAFWPASWRVSEPCSVPASDSTTSFYCQAVISKLAQDFT